MDEVRLQHSYLVSTRAVLPPHGKTVSFDEQGISDPVDTETAEACVGVPGFGIHIASDEGEPQGEDQSNGKPVRAKRR